MNSQPPRFTEDADIEIKALIEDAWDEVKSRKSPTEEEWDRAFNANMKARLKECAEAKSAVEAAGNEITRLRAEVKRSCIVIAVGSISAGIVIAGLVAALTCLAFGGSFPVLIDLRNHEGLFLIVLLAVLLVALWAALAKRDRR